MRYIKKGVEPQTFTNWKALKNEQWEPTYDNLAGDPKKDVYLALLAEQGYLCCYCERELFADDYHVEHLNPQAMKAGDDLIYENFLCSCLNVTAKGDPLHCGKLKGDEVIDVNPLQQDCSAKFSFTAYGEIIGLTEAAKSTIKTLGLDIKKLVDMRKGVLDPFLDDSIEEADFIDFVSGYLDPPQLGKLSPFQSMVNCVLKG